MPSSEELKPVAWRWRVMLPDPPGETWQFATHWSTPPADAEPLYAHPAPTTADTGGLVEREPLDFHRDRLDASMRELWAARSLDLHMCDGTTKKDWFGFLHDLRTDVRVLRDRLDSTPAAGLPANAPEYEADDQHMKAWKRGWNAMHDEAAPALAASEQQLAAAREQIAELERERDYWKEKGWARASAHETIRAVRLRILAHDLVSALDCIDAALTLAKETPDGQ